MSIPILLQTFQPEIDTLVHITLPEPTKHPDVIWFNQMTEPLTIDLVRKLQKEVLTRPYQADVRFFILHAIELATIEAQQALLKLLEEPPKHVSFILTTQYPDMVLSTILSRVRLVSKKREEQENGAEDSLNHIESKTIGQKLEWASKQASEDNPTGVVLSLLSNQIKTMKQQPNMSNIQKVKLLEQTLEMFRAKTNPKLCFEWLALHVS